MIYGYRQALLLLVLCGLMAGTLNAAVVRGKLQRTASSGTVPAAGISVTVWSQQHGRSAAAVSGQDGMYYLPNVAAGSYTLEVWTGGGKRLTYQLKVAEPYTDVPPVTVP